MVSEIEIVVFLTFLLAGTVKGVIGMGLPTVSLAVLAVALDLTSAMALLLVPSLVTNFWQALVGGQFISLLKRLWAFLLLAGGTVIFGSMALSLIDLSWLSALLGLLLVVYSLTNLIGFRLSVPQSRESSLGPVMGICNGVLTGMTGSFVVPGVMYLQAIGLSRDSLVQAMGILFSVSTVALLGALMWQGLLTSSLGITSTWAIIPAIIGMIVGQKIRKNIPQDRFRLVFFYSILILGMYILMNNLMAVSSG